MSKIAVTGERFIPESNDVELELEHMQRYYSASGFVKHKTVLDAACGEGYGSRMLAQKADKVIGVDLDTDTINKARIKYADINNLKFIQGSIGKLDFIADSSIDVVVSFETIEHVTEELQLHFIKEINRILKPDGILIMSSPNKKEYTDRYDFHNKYHVHELYVDEFVSLLKNKFKNIRLYRQFLEVVSLIDRADMDEEIVSYHKDRHRYNPQGKYVIAVAGNTELPQKSFSIASLHLREEYLHVLDELNYCRLETMKCREMVRQSETYTDKLQKENDAKKNEIKLCNEEMDRRIKELEHRMDVINSLNEKNGKLENDLKLCNEELDRRAAELEHRMDVINTQNERIQVLENSLKLSNEELDRRAAELEHRMDVINGLRQENIELKGLPDSKR